jgi:hypothetical protein|tara:strand:- start:12430 stop:13674 length:1245 start_codon:yes stop_codon:yes gene_type:complete
MADAKIITFGELFSATTDVIPDNKAAAVEIEGLDGNDYIKIDTTDGSEAVQLVSSGTGKVGVGPTAPLDQLHVSSSADTGTHLKFTHAGTGHTVDDGGYVGMQNGANGMRVYNREASPIAFGTSNAEAMRIDADGDLGVGTTNPESPFVVHNLLPAGRILAEFRGGGASGANTVVNIRADGVGDPKIYFSLDTSTNWVMGVDNSDDDKFKISGHYNLESNTRLTIDSVGVTTLSSSPAGTDTGGLILTNSNGGSETFVQARNTGDSLYSYGFGRHRSGSFQVTQKANSTYGGAAQTVLLIDPEEGSHTNTFSEAVTGNVTDQYCAALKIDPAFTADSASTFTVTNSNYISLQDPAAANAGSGDLNITNAPVFKLDAALGTHKATTNTDKSSGTASGTLKVDVNGTLYHIQLYAD